MKLEQQVTSLILSKKLKELGVKQESYFMWVGDGVWNPTDVSDYETLFTPSRTGWVSAFTVAELGEMLPKTIKKGRNEYWLRFEVQAFQDGWSCQYNSVLGLGRTLRFFETRTIADAGAQMLIYLLENKLI